MLMTLSVRPARAIASSKTRSSTNSQYARTIVPPYGSYQTGEPHARSSTVLNFAVAEYVLPLRVMLQHPSYPLAAPVNCPACTSRPVVEDGTQVIGFNAATLEAATAGIKALQRDQVERRARRRKRASESGRHRARRRTVRRRKSPDTPHPEAVTAKHEIRQAPFLSRARSDRVKHRCHTTRADDLECRALSFRGHKARAPSHSSRRWCFAMSFGSNVPSRSRGTAISTGPVSV